MAIIFAVGIFALMVQIAATRQRRAHEHIIVRVDDSKWSEWTPTSQAGEQGSGRG